MSGHVVKIVPFSPRFESEVVDLILSIQRGEFEIDITAEQQPDLRSIPSFYQIARGREIMVHEPTFEKWFKKRRRAA